MKKRVIAKDIKALEESALNETPVEFSDNFLPKFIKKLERIRAIDNLISTLLEDQKPFTDKEIAKVAKLLKGTKKK